MEAHPRLLTTRRQLLAGSALVFGSRCTPTKSPLRSPTEHFLRLRITSSPVCIALAEFGVYLQPQQ